MKKKSNSMITLIMMIMTAWLFHVDLFDIFCSHHLPMRSSFSKPHLRVDNIAFIEEFSIKL